MRGKAELAGRTPYAVGEPAAGRIVCGKQMICLILSALILWLLTGCMVDQHPEDARTTAVETVETMLTITDPVEKAAVEKAKSEVRAMDAEWAFLNLRSVQGMYRSIQELGEIFDREDQTQTMVEEFQDFYEEYKSQNEGKAHPKVMILMGLPGSYIIATENSYVGSLVELAGGENVYAGTDQEFLTVNTEDMEKKNPDVILRAAHALPDQVVEMFKEDFETNDIWKHFSAVQNGRVYDLTYEYFGMSANFYYPEALKELQPMLYPDSAAGAGTAGNSASGDNASGAASDDKKEGATS